jgi:ATP-binding cassette subfamily B protein
LIVINFLVFDNLTWRSIGYIRAKYVPLIINRMVSQTVTYVLEHSSQFFQDNLSGKITKQITNLSDGLETLICTVFTNFLRGGSLVIIAFITSYFVNPIFCLIMVVWFILFASASLLMSSKFVSLSDKLSYAESTVVGEIVDTISNQSNIRMFANSKFENKRLVPFLDKQRIAYFNTYFYALIMHSVQGGLIALMMGFAGYFLIKLYNQNLLTVGDFALIFGLAMETGHMMWFTMSQVDEFNKAVGKCKQSISKLITPTEIQDSADAKLLVCDKGKINFNNVVFHYKGTNPLFNGLNVDIESGQKVGLVGYSGSGKSTFVNLILRFYDVTKGSILIDEQNIKEVTQESIRQHIAMIPQEPSMFHRSIMENIRYGKLNASDEEVIAAAMKAHAHEFIEQLPNKYSSLVGERGIKLSGGQRQRIAIARAILKNAPILILDEATSQLDSVTEALIQDSIWELMQNKTTLIIAHRLSTLLHMDRILVFDKGQIVEDGTHEQLLLNNGLYKKLWDSQVGGFLPNERI